ncbi:hypothetical protein NQ317_012211 [Molorchus minor]|uniref:Uncharacterized protein n=1 Tax=Molorchus minor TaxID=1323400 RepID=A0ABQ9JD06_9CUCU|nr:hypothetical protein NQ317_012211 [Molorchus minor]
MSSGGLISNPNSMPLSPWSKQGVLLRGILARPHDSNKDTSQPEGLTKRYQGRSISRNFARPQNCNTKFSPAHWKRPVEISCTMNNCESEEIVEAANIAISNLLPTKSRSLYDIAYNRFKKWCAEKNVQVYSENVLLAYFSENAKNYKSSTLWAQYSMVKCLIIYDNIDISKFPKLIAFLKRTGDGYQAKKSKY